MTVSRRIGEEMVLVPVRQNVGDLESIYTLNSVGALLWERLEEAQTVENLAAAVAAEFEVMLEQAAADAEAFFNELTALHLVETTE